MKERIAILLGYMESQWAVINTIFDKIEAMKPLDESQIIHSAYLMHNLYNAWEDMFKEISVCFENNVERSSGFHKNILLRMKISIPGLRPQILSDGSYELFNELLGFRHVFRHAYNYNLDPEKLQQLRNKVLKGRVQIENDIELFRKYIEGLLQF
jgi:hypothetical protein